MSVLVMNNSSCLHIIVLKILIKIWNGEEIIKLIVEGHFQLKRIQRKKVPLKCVFGKILYFCPLEFYSARENFPLPLN